MATTLPGDSMSGGYFRSRFAVWTRALLLIVVSLGAWAITSEVFSFSLAFKRAQVTAEPDGLRGHSEILASERTPSSRVGSIMALLATLDEAGILPPEGTAPANQLVHGLIQLQAAFLKSTSPELAAYLMAAEKHWILKHNEREYGSFATSGLTSRVLEALILYDKENPMWVHPNIVAAVQAFNVTGSDWVLIVDIFIQAETVFRDQGRSIHELYDQWRVKMPGGNS
jgi:hypothetical protein